MSRFPVSAEKERQLLARMARLGLREDDIEERFIKGSGPGGQKINKTSSCVQLHHTPSGIEVRCQATRSQALNRFAARRELCDKFEGEVLKEKTKRQSAAEKIRRQKRRRSRRQKEKILTEKRQHSTRKSTRRKVDPRQDD